MGVPGFYSWLVKRYPMIKQMLGKYSVPEIDHLLLDMNGIIYKCVKDERIIFKAQILPKELEEIWLEIYNYINMIVQMLKPTKMLFLALDGVAPRSKMNNQRARRFKSARDYKAYLETFHGVADTDDSQENFKNNSISPGTTFMQQLNEMLDFCIKKKIEEDDNWKEIKVIFTGSDTPGEGEHKIMEFLRSNRKQFNENDTFCLYGADADLIMLGLTLPFKNVCIIREEFVFAPPNHNLSKTREEKTVQFQMIFINLLREYFDLEYRPLESKMKNLVYSIQKIIKDFVFLFFFIGNDFLPRVYAYNIRDKEIENLIGAFKRFLIDAESYVIGEDEINLVEFARLTGEIAKQEYAFLQRKVEDYDKILEGKKEFDSDFTELTRQKVKKESEFVLQLKQFYQNFDNTARHQFYRQKFEIDPLTQTEEFYRVLGNYTYGLKFVYEYYFKNLPSWSWYYDYYYAPLIGDLAMYVAYLANSGIKLQDFNLDEPSRPFKQLLCILPKESSELLPQPFQHYIVDEESPLRKPIDYYPNDFEDDLYGSTRAYEAISKLPFLDLKLISEIYEETVQKVPQNLMIRNQFAKTKLYEYSPQKPIQVKSPFNEFPSFECPVTITQIELLTPSKLHFPKHKHHEQQNKEKMPTLSMRLFECVQETVGRQAYKSFTIKVKPSNEIQDFKVGMEIYYGYPLEHSGRIQALLSPDGFHETNSFEPSSYFSKYDLSKYYDNSDNIRINKSKLFGTLLDIIKKEYRFLNFTSITRLAFIIDTTSVIRTLQGTFKRAYEDKQKFQFSIIPDCMLSLRNFYPNTIGNFKFISIEQEFNLHQEVLLTTKDDYCGSKAKVIGYNKDKTKVVVRLTERLKKIKLDTLLKMISVQDLFFDLKFVAAIMDASWDILLTMLGSVLIKLPNEKDKDLPTCIDIGLNFINHRDEKLVPNLVRINFDNTKEHEKNRFMHLELSVRAVEMLIEYKQKYPEVIRVIIKRHRDLIKEAQRTGDKINWGQAIQIDDLYQSEDNIKSLLKVYIWLLKQEETHLPLCSIYSKQVTAQKIRKLEDYFIDHKKKKIKYQEFREAAIDPNFLYSVRLAKKGQLHLQKSPKNHAIADQVICIKPEFFGHFGVIVGIDDTNYEVLFEKPSIGKTDLGGICSHLRGGKFKMRQLLNLDLWPQIFTEREFGKVSFIKNLGWAGNINSYVPKFKGRSLSNFNDFKLLIDKDITVKFFSESMIDFILKAKQGLKQVNIDKEYIIMDNKKGEYKFKYDKKETTIQKEQVQQAIKVKKYIEKKAPIEETIDPTDQDIIENKIEALQIQEKVESDKEIGEEEDADDILG